MPWSIQPSRALAEQKLLQTIFKGKKEPGLIVQIFPAPHSDSCKALTIIEWNNVLLERKLKSAETQAGNIICMSSSCLQFANLEMLFFLQPPQIIIL